MYGTYGVGIDDDGRIAGIYYDTATTSHGFVRSTEGEQSRINVEGSQMTQATAINDVGDIVGFYLDGIGL